MIASTVARWPAERFAFPSVFARAFSFLQEHDCLKLPQGSRQLQGDALFVNIEHVITSPREERRFEVHGRYLDIHVLLQGVERHDFHAHPEQPALLENRLEAGDIAFYAEVAGSQSVILRPLDYVVYFPGEFHRPCCAVGQGAPIIKAIFKIRRDLLEGRG